MQRRSRSLCRAEVGRRPRVVAKPIDGLGGVSAVRQRAAALGLRHGQGGPTGPRRMMRYLKELRSVDSLTSRGLGSWACSGLAAMRA